MAYAMDIERPVSANAAKGFERAAVKYFQEGMSRGFAVSLEEAPEDRGKLKQTAFAPDQRADGSIVWGYTAPYAEAQEEGTPPFTPPKRPLLEWGDRVAGDPGVGMIAWHKIRREGLDAQRFMQAGADAARDWFRNHDFSAWLDREF